MTVKTRYETVPGNSMIDGTATDADVLEYKRQLRLVGRINQRVVRCVSQMLSAINQNRDQLVQNGKHILGLQHNVEKGSSIFPVCQRHLYCLFS